MATKLLPVGSQFQVNLDTNNGQALPEIAWLGAGRFVVVYQSEFLADRSDSDILGQFVNADGTLSGFSIPIATFGGIQAAPAVAPRGGGGFTTVWVDLGTVTGSPVADCKAPPWPTHGRRGAQQARRSARRSRRPPH